MNFRKRGEVVAARRLERCLEASDGEKLAACGDWIVNRSNGERLRVDGQVFKTEYEPLVGPNPFNDPASQQSHEP